MKTNKSIVGFSLVLALACLYQLSFTWKARSFESQAHTFAQKQAKLGFSEKEMYRRYIDSLGNKEFYNLGIANYTYFECKQREVNLGLDLRGGMNVILEVDKGAIIKGLANDNKDAGLLKAIAATDEIIRNEGGDYVEVFMEQFQKSNADRKIAYVFAKGNRGTIKSSSGDEEVKNMLEVETESAINRVYEVVEKRINQSNVTQPTIQKVDGGRISVELPGVDNPRRMEDLVEKSAKLEFYEVYSNSANSQESARILNDLYKASKMGNVMMEEDTTSEAGLDSTAVAETNEDMSSAPLASILRTYGNGQGSAMCVVKSADRDRLVKMLAEPQYQSVLEPAVKVAFSAKPTEYDAQGKEIQNSDEYLVYFLKRDRDGNAALSSDDENIIADARENTNQTGQLEVSMTMTPTAASRWAQVTGANVGKFIAIVLDDRVYSAPVVNEKIGGGQSQISGNFDIREAQDLANVLKAGKLPAPARIVASEVVGPSMGDASIQRGLNSLLFGFLSTVLFMILYYNRAGWISIVAVLGNVFIILGVLSSLGAALTLPGMAGIILTVGMAVDANVLIYERIKDELAAGKGLKLAINDGFKHALSAIIDSNITTLLAGFLMTFAGAGPVYGFAVILVIGIFSSLFTALFITRLLLDRRADAGKETAFDTSWNRGFLKGVNIDFVSKRRYFYIGSLTFIALGAITFIMKGGISTGIDFKGGNAYIIQFNPDKNYNAEDIKQTLNDALAESSNEVKTFGTEGQFRIVTTYLLNEDSREARDKVAQDVVSALEGKFEMVKNADGEGPILSSSKVGAAIATSTRNKSAFLVILAIAGIFLYIMFRFRSVSYGLGATVALIHDVAIVLSIFAMLDGVVPFPTEFDQHLIAALLTLLGYSINDTVIVFDRIREYLTERRTEKNNAGMINDAINSTLSRTIVTAATVFLVLTILFIFGGDALKSFSMALLIGVVVGTYSSICIATPVVVDFTSKKKQ